jgi:hypothetical protein
MNGAVTLVAAPFIFYWKLRKFGIFIKRDNNHCLKNISFFSLPLKNNGHEKTGNSIGSFI